MSSTDAWHDQRISISGSNDFDPIVLAHIRDRLATLDQFSLLAVRVVDIELRHMPVVGYGKVIRAEAWVRLDTGCLRAEADGDSVCAAVEKVRDRLCLQLIEQGIRTEAERLPDRAPQEHRTLRDRIRALWSSNPGGTGRHRRPQPSEGNGQEPMSP